MANEDINALCRTGEGGRRLRREVGGGGGREGFHITEYTEYAT